jgi:hypothetical protein
MLLKTAVYNGWMSTIFSAVPMPLVDLQSITGSKGLTLSGSGKEEVVFEFLTCELEQVGGQAVIEVDDSGYFCIWNPPSTGEALPPREIYFSHMLQAGLMVLPRRIIASTAYAGNGLALARALVAINSENKYVAERDSTLLAEAMPLSGAAWLANGIILLENKQFKKAIYPLTQAVILEPKSYLACKCLTVALTGVSSRKAVSAAEMMVMAYADAGIPMDAGARAAYGFALASAGMKVEAKAQFLAGFGKGMPKMTLKQWRDWGHKLQLDYIEGALYDPAKFFDSKKG